jgi:teichuronic acid biosynthesis glycosyltransferase TuaH
MYMSGDWDGMVVVCAGTPWDGVPSSERQLAERLADHAPVLYVDPPYSPVTLWRRGGMSSVRGPRLRRVGDRVARLTPVVLPGMHRPGVHLVTERLMRRILRRTVATLGGRVRATVIASHNVYYGACGEELKVLYATDDFAAGAALMGIGERQILDHERRHADEADLVVTVSPTLADKWRALGQRPVVVPNGCAAEFLASCDDAPVPDDVTLPGPIVGFVGHISDRIDISMLEAVADRGVSLLLVGPRQSTFEPERFDALVGRENVSWVGPKPFSELPSYLRTMTVGITPYADTAFNRASFPLKTLDYLAAGRGVVATDLPAVHWLKTDLVTVARAPEEFADRVVDAVHQRVTPELRARRRELARANSWAARADDFHRLLGLGRAAPDVPELRSA